MRCGKPSRPIVAQMTVRSSSRNAPTSASDILIWSRRLTAGTVASPAAKAAMCVLLVAVVEGGDALAVTHPLALVAVDAGHVLARSAVGRGRRAGGGDVDEVTAIAAERAVASERRVDRVVAGAR